MVFGQSLEYHVRNVFQNHAENETDQFQISCFFRKTSYEVKGSGQRLGINIFGSPPLGRK